MPDSIVIVALLIALYILRKILFASPKTDDPISLGSNSSKDDEEPVLEGKFTPKTLYKFNGFDTEKIYIGVKGKVYDVSKGRNFYGPSGPYSNFAGHDASRGLALNSFDLECVRSFDEPLDPLDDLTREQQASLDGWEEMFKEKYPCIGTLVNEDDL